MAQQLRFTVQIYQQINLAAQRTWKELPTKGDRSLDISSIRQCPEESFQEFVTHLSQAVGSTIADCQAGQLDTFENANKDKYPEAYVTHYMDDILLGHPLEATVLLIFGDMQLALEQAGLCIALKKVTPLFTTMEEHSLSFHAPCSASFSSGAPFHEDCSISSQAGVINIEKDLMDGKLLNVISEAMKTWKTVPSTSVNIAVTGASGNGMSSFINALRNIGHEEKTSAPTGVVRTTYKPTSYSSSYFPNVVLWDLPGMSTSPQALEDYLKEMQFSQYDLIIIIASEQFSMSHVMLAKGIKRLAKKFYIVWTKLDTDIRTSALKKEQLLETIQEHILENLQKEQVCEPSIFLVSSLDPSLHDFPNLMKTLRMDIFRIRCQEPLQNLLHTCEKIINEKMTSLKKNIDTQSFHCIIDPENLDNSEECLKAYKVLFGVDNESLQQVAQKIGTEVLKYTSNMKSQDLQILSNVDWIQFFGLTETHLFQKEEHHLGIAVGGEY
ncbi:PREDICTED: immunity-related GTPase family M protein 1-like [Chrysochloris asiatica]|uniref:Immunity-related GTPase family M protein 1-like n=1 Tax=Chrysochloris asiatica TaxID=185453 RepID=A0A9B0WZD3_CHRAS|nr:PREDICTED: immunity-related GTPase family M protein 1-like [Chrysochloris asiatica]